MWKGFQSSNTQTGHGERKIPLDPLDAQDIEKAVSALPDAQRFAVRWCYVYSGQPRKAAQQVGETLEGLYLLIVGGRNMLINRRI